MTFDTCITKAKLNKHQPFKVRLCSRGNFGNFWPSRRRIPTVGGCKDKGIFLFVDILNEFDSGRSAFLP
jgi:hypothetical protein